MPSQNDSGQRNESAVTGFEILIPFGISAVSGAGVAAVKALTTKSEDPFTIRVYSASYDQKSETGWWQIGIVNRTTSAAAILQARVNKADNVELYDIKNTIGHSMPDEEKHGKMRSLPILLKPESLTEFELKARPNAKNKYDELELDVMPLNGKKAEQVKSPLARLSASS